MRIIYFKIDLPLSSIVVF